MIFSAPLIDGPLHAPHETREALVARMADKLVKYDSFRSESDAIRTLLNPPPKGQTGFSSFDVLRFVDDARQVAMQEVVAREIMDKPT